jgi:hypothetical protein
LTAVWAGKLEIHRGCPRREKTAGHGKAASRGVGSFIGEGAAYVHWNGGSRQAWGTLLHDAVGEGLPWNGQ